jgi:predicted GNAT family N-acyltransferase
MSKRKIQTSDAPNKKHKTQQKQQKQQNFMWMSHGCILGDVFTLPSNVNVIFAVRLGYSCSSSEQLNYIHEHFKTNDIPGFALHNNKMYNTDKSPQYQHRIVYHGGQTIPNLRLWWGDLPRDDGDGQPGSKFGLSPIPTGNHEHKQSYSLGEQKYVHHDKVESTLRKLTNYLSQYRTSGVANVYIVSCRADCNWDWENRTSDVFEQRFDHSDPRRSFNKIIQYERKKYTTENTQLQTMKYNFNVGNVSNYNVFIKKYKYLIIELMDDFKDCFNIQDISKSLIPPVNENTVCYIYHADLIFAKLHIDAMCFVVPFKHTTLARFGQSNQKLADSQYIYNLCVSKASRRSGKCKQLIEKIINEYRGKVHSLSLHVANNEYSEFAGKCYLDNGFTETDITYRSEDNMMNTIYLYEYPDMMDIDDE